MTSTNTSTNEHLQAIHAECSGFVDGEPPDLEVIIQHAEALAAQIERLQRALVEARRRCNHLWLKSVPDSTPYDPIFQDYLGRQLEPDDLPDTKGSTR